MMSAKKILVPIKGDAAGENAFRLACELSKDSKAKLYALYIIEIKQELPLDAVVDSTEGETALNRIEAISHREKCHVEAGYLQARRAGPAIIQEIIERGSELLVLGISYKHHFGHFAVGETSSYVIKNAPCPVILWREPIGIAAGVEA